MTNAVATPSINLNAMGIQEIDKAVRNGQINVAQAFNVVQGRIDKRLAKGQSLLKPVVEFRNTLAASLNGTTGNSIPAIPVPTYQQPHPTLPTDPEQLADVVFATVGAANIGAVISRLTARVIGA